jgi:hypothetical protein
MKSGLLSAFCKLIISYHHLLILAICLGISFGWIKDPLGQNPCRVGFESEVFWECSDKHIISYKNTVSSCYVLSYTGKMGNCYSS